MNAKQRRWETMALLEFDDAIVDHNPPTSYDPCGDQADMSDWDDGEPLGPEPVQPVQPIEPEPPF